MTGDPVPHWPGRMLTLASGRQVWVAEAGGPAGESGRELVLCVHGMTGDATNWTDFLAELTPDFDGLAVDLPGSGFSPPPGRRGWSITAHAATVTELIETLDAGPVHLVGNSMGGAVSVRVAARRPDLIRTLTLISAALPDRRPHRQTAHFPVIALPLLGSRLIRQFGRLSAEDRIAGVIRTCYYDPAAVHPARFALSAEELRRRDTLPYDVASVALAARTLVAETLRPYRFSLWREAELIQLPALVLFGSHDRLVSPSLAGRAARTFPNARVAVLPETGHLGQMEHPATVASMFREMVAESDTHADAAGNSRGANPVDA
ncbi:MAG TPA: alpha/beta fold hydrolase [Trebonia sp.]|nr:alpha/beta fold hydrolase [Trebonia sp.]